MSSLIGAILCLVALVAAAAIIYGFVTRGRARPTVGDNRGFIPTADVARLDPNRQRVDALAKFQAIQPGQTIITATDDYFLVRGVVNLAELTIVGDSDQWTPTGREFVLAQSDDEMGRAMAFAWLPSAEGGDLRLYRLTPQDAAGWTQFLAGTDDHPGPARHFADLDQRQDLSGDELKSIRFSKLESLWQMTDIGQARYRASGQAFVAGQGELRFALAQEVGGPQRLLFVDFLTGGSASTDGLFVGQEYDPTLIKDVQAYTGKSARGLQNA